MRQAQYIWDNWEWGNYVGDGRPNARVFIEPDWYLNLTDKNYADTGRGPYRWYQRAANDQVEVELSNVRDISIDRSIDTDVASMNMAIYNQWMDVNGASPEIVGQLGKPGFFTWDRGNSDYAASRWNHTENEWNNVIIPNALIRTYQGFGGHDLSLDDALTAGNLVLTGVWLIDSVTVGSDGIMSVRCRDIGKVLREQLVFPPLVPSSEYPIEFCRWVFENYKANYNPRPPIITGGVEEISPKYLDSSADRWYGPNADIHGHRGTDSVDGSLETFALSVGNSHPTRVFCADWFSYEVNGKVNEIYMHPWLGNYELFISVKENGVWQTNGEGNILYSEDPLYGTQPTVVYTEADIPFVMRSGVGWEEGRWYQLPRTFNASEIRLTFRNHQQSQWGPWFYRCGIRDVKMRVNTQVVSPPADPWTFALENYDNPDVGFEEGYWAAADDGQLFAFGDAPMLTPGINFEGISGVVNTIRSTVTGQGLWMLQEDGVVHSFGDAEDYGSGSSGTRDYIDMAVTRAGLGYYLLRRNGTVEPCGDAIDYGVVGVEDFPSNGAFARSWLSEQSNAYMGLGIDTHPTLDGFWVVNGDGEVACYGDVPDYGGIIDRDGLAEREWVRGFRRNSDGTGYWMLGGLCKIWNFGAAEFYGEGAQGFGVSDNLNENYRELTWQIAPCSNDEGYRVIKANGDIIGFGDFYSYGQPGGTGSVRKPGNYLDYSDIVKFLLGWSGFLLHEDNPDSSRLPVIYGNIEDTGIFADECLPKDLFDKKAPIDAINTLKEIVGYIFYIDDEGAAHFESPNWWSIGNFYSDGTPTDFIPEIDESTVLTSHQVNYSDVSARSEIIIGTEEPDASVANSETITTRLVPASSSLLRGMVKPAMWTNGVFKNEDEQRIMAELIAMHIWFQQRQGNTECLANPCIGINDQVRIFERTTGESYVHYVRGVSTNMNLDTGEYTMSLTTHWLGEEDYWVITKDNVLNGDGNIPGVSKIQVSDKLGEWLDRQSSAAASNAVLNNFASSVDATVGTSEAQIADEGDGGVGHE